MKKLWIFKLLLMFIVAIVSSAIQAQQRKKLDLNGLWNTDKGEVVKVTQSGSSIIGTLVSGGECPFGAPTRTTYFEGQLRGFSQDGTASLDGTVYLCTRTRVLYDCGFGNFGAQIQGIAREKTITITYKSEYYRDDRRKLVPKIGKSDDNESKDKKCPHNWVRDPSGDSEKKNTLTRVTCEPANGIPCSGPPPSGAKSSSGGTLRKAVAKGRKKGVNKAAGATEKGAEKVKEKTAPD
ncbi:MAG: hypothetical protein M3Y84_07935 [Acidobacteriota bacterium]|nr:hypothetical protein [Acidobacteriota bacterium]